MFRTALLALLLACSGCASTIDIVEFHNHGPVDFEKQARVKTAFAQLRDTNAPAPSEVEVYDSNYPPGLITNGSVLTVARGAPFRLVGTFTLNYRKLTSFFPTPQAAIEDAKRMAASAGANVVICRLAKGSDTEHVLFMSGYLVQRVQPIAPTQATPAPVAPRPEP